MTKTEEMKIKEELVNLKAKLGETKNEFESLKHSYKEFAEYHAKYVKEADEHHDIHVEQDAAMVEALKIESHDLVSRLGRLNVRLAQYGAEEFELP